MPIPEPILSAIVEAIFGYVLEQSGSADWLREKLGRDPAKRAYARALDSAIDEFRGQHPEAEEQLFDESFLQREAAPILAQFLLRDGRPSPNALANAWADSLRIRDPERRATWIREQTLVAADFLHLLGHKLKAQRDLDDINDRRARETAIDHLAAIRQKLQAERSTADTRNQYLHWLIEHTLYLDTRGTSYSQVTVKLDEVYISLQAQRENTPGAIDRRLVAEELEEIEARLARLAISAEEAEQRRAQRWAQLRGRIVVAPSAGPDETLELSEAVTRHGRLMVLGDPGCGKTTLTRYLALKHAQALYQGRADAGDGLGPARFPILVRIAHYAADDTWKRMSLSDFLPAYCKQNECNPPGLEHLLHSELERGTCLILLDGLDEIVSGDARRDVIQRIENFVRRHDDSGNRFVVTSRSTGYRAFLFSEPFAHYLVQRMNEEQIERFLSRWCHAVEAAQTPDLSPERRARTAQAEIDAIMLAVRSSPGVRQIATNPLMLRILAGIKRKGAGLPRRRVELYRDAAEALASAHDVARADLPLPQGSYLTRLLGRIAYWLHDTEPTGLAAEHEVKDFLYQAWAEIHRLAQDTDEPDPEINARVEQFLRAVREHTGLFVERAYKLYGFMHQSFEEYYAARHLITGTRQRAARIRKHLHDPRWEEPILLGLGFLGLDMPVDAAELVETAILAQGEDAQKEGFTASPYETLLGRDFLFALRCLGDDIPVDPEIERHLVARLVGELVERGGSGKYQPYRDALAERFVALKETSVAPSLIAALDRVLLDDSAEPQVRFNAAQALINMGQHPSDQLLTALLNTLTDPDPIVRVNAVQSLINVSRHAPERILPALIDALADPDLIVRVNAAPGLIAVGQHAPELVLPALLDALADPRTIVRRQAIQPLLSLSRHAPDLVVSRLRSALADPDVAVQLNTAQALINIGQHDADGLLATLSSALVDPDADLRRNAAQIMIDLSRITPDPVFHALAAGLADADAFTRRQAIAVMSRLGESAPNRVLPLLSAALHDPDPIAALSAAQGLIGLDQHAVDQVLPLLSQKLADPDLRWLAVQGLTRLGQSAPSRAIPLLAAALDDTAVFVGINAVQGLTSIGQHAPDVVLPLLSNVITAPESDPNLRWQAIRSLTDLARPALDHVLTLLSTLLNDPDHNLRWQAVRGLTALAQDGDRRVIPALNSALSDPDANVRWQAAQALTRFPPYSAELLAISVDGLLQASSWEIRNDFAAFLGDSQQVHDAVIDALFAGLLDLHGAVRHSCARALARLGRTTSTARAQIATKLEHALADPSFDVPDNTSRQSGHDYAFASLWMLLVDDVKAGSA
jgi:HEAT repeat protein